MKNKTDTNIEEVLNQFVKKYHPDIIISDNESGFKSKIVQSMLNKENVTHDMVDIGDHKALGVVDRAVKTIKDILYKFMKEEDTTRWKDELTKIIEAYNNTPHQGINDLTPNEVFKPANTITIQILNNKKDELNKKRRPQFKVGDTVRIRIQKTKFSRSYDEKYSNKQYTIKSIDGPKAILKNDDEISLRNLLKVVSTEKETGQELNNEKKKSKINKAIQKEHLEVENKEYKNMRPKRDWKPSKKALDLD